MSAAVKLIYGDGLSIVRGFSSLPRDAATEFLEASDEEREQIRTAYLAERDERRRRAALAPPPEPASPVKLERKAVDRRPNKIDPLQRKHILELNSLGLSCRAIARRLGVNRKTIDRVLGVVDDDRKRRVKRLEANLTAWATTAKLILVGRDIAPVSGWLDIMKHPIGDAELAAQVDFIYFLRQCRRYSVPMTARALEISEDRVRAALSSRGVKA